MIIVIAILSFTVGLSAAMINATLEEIAQCLREIAEKEISKHEN